MFPTKSSQPIPLANLGKDCTYHDMLLPFDLSLYKRGDVPVRERVDRFINEDWLRRRRLVLERIGLNNRILLTT